MHFIYDEIGNYHMLLFKNIKHDIFVWIEKKRVYCSSIPLLREYFIVIWYHKITKQTWSDKSLI